MFLDSGTLRDLEILPTATTRGMTLWQLIDRTRSRAGRDALRHRFADVAQSEQDIIALQHAHQSIASCAASYRTVLDRSALDVVEEYLQGSWQLPADMGRFIWRRRWHRDYLRDVALGQLRIRGLLVAAAELRQLLTTTDSAVLATLARQISNLLDTSLARDLLRLSSKESSRDRRAFDQVARDRGKAVISSLIECLGKVESLWSVATATLEHGWSYPRPAKRLAVCGLFHPFLGPLSARNDLEIARDVRVGFVTGPNMAGKTTFMKSVAVAVCLAHIGSGVPATSMEFPVVGTVFSSIDISDNLNAGESFYLAEVRRIRALAMALGVHRSGLAVIDEPFRGTNVHDATEATLAMLTRLAALPVGLVLVASHVSEVVSEIRDDPRILLIHFSADITDHGPRFDYKLREGVSTQRLGMTLLKQERVLELLERLGESEEMDLRK
jgi:DNA mismatch repair protein MutS